MLKFLRRPRVVATVNLVVMAGLGALLFYMDSNTGPSRRGTGFYLGMGFICLFELFWIWVFIANPLEWANVTDGRLQWRRGHVFPSRGSVAIHDVSQILEETLTTPQNPQGIGHVQYWVVLKDGTKVRVPEAATDLEVLYSMRALNPSIEKKCTSRPL